MDISFYFEPVLLSDNQHEEDKQPNKLKNIISIYTQKNYFPNLSDCDIAIIGVNEDRRSINNTGCSEAPDIIRKYLYELFAGDYAVQIADLGNIKSGHRIEDTYFALTSVISELIKNEIVPIIIGGSQDLVYANYLAYENLGQIINIVHIDDSFDLGNTDDILNSKTYLSKIITHQPNFLFNYTNIGYQTYFVDQKAIDLMKNLYFDTYRLGLVRSNLQEVEPIVRNADMLCFDISAIKQSDAPGNGNASPNGFYGEESCQITRYAGISDKLTSIGFYETNPSLDINDQTSHLVAQMIWYFIDGFYNRKNDLPHKQKDEYIKYVVTIKNHQDILFYKSKKSDRWWMEVPCPLNLQTKYERHCLVPCSYNDYQTACKEDIPDRWWQAYQKLM